MDLRRQKNVVELHLYHSIRLNYHLKDLENVDTQIHFLQTATLSCAVDSKLDNITMRFEILESGKAKKKYINMAELDKRNKPKRIKVSFS